MYMWPLGSFPTDGGLLLREPPEKATYPIMDLSISLDTAVAEAVCAFDVI